MSKPVLLLVVALLAASASAEPDPRIPPALVRQPNRDAGAFFVRDAKRPNLLHPSARAQRDGLGREYVEAMVRPPIDPAILDELEAIKGKRTSKLQAPVRAPNPALITRSGEVIIIQGDSLTANTSQGTTFDHNNGFIDVANLVLSQYGDNFDFISVWTTFPDQSVAAYYFPLKQDTTGLGDCNFNTGETFGCEFDQTGGQLQQLQGLVFMNSVSMWQEWDRNFDGVVHPLDSFDSACYSTLGQEIAHRWGSGLRFRDPRNGSVSKKLLGRDNSHWAAYLDTDASVMDGWDWKQVGDRFDLVNDMDIYSDLDLYTMGALAPGLVKDFFFIENAVFDEDDGLGIDGRPIPKDAVLSFGLPSVGYMESLGYDVGARGDRVDVTMADVMAVEGTRCPDVDHTQRAFRQAFVLVTRPGESEAQAQDDAADLEVVEATWEAWWHDRTGRALSLCSSLDGDCEHAKAVMGGEDDVAVDIGGKGELKVVVRADDATVKNAVLSLSLSGQAAGDAELDDTTIEMGDIAKDATRTIKISFSVSDKAKCGLSFVVDAVLSSDNARDEIQAFRVLPGFKNLVASGFGDGEDGFKVNDDGKDGATTGELEWRAVETSCEASPFAPERDNSSDNRGAFVTSGRLDGDTSLWSKEIDLKGAIDPSVRFAYWLDGSGSLKVQLSRDGGDTFKDADVYKEPGHSWAQGVVSVRKAFDDELPESVIARFIFDSNGGGEGGIDDFRVADVDGVCLERSAYGHCGCDSSGAATPQSSLAFLAAGLALRALRRRRR